MGSKILKRRISGSRSSMGVPVNAGQCSVSEKCKKEHFRQASTSRQDGRRVSARVAHR